MMDNDVPVFIVVMVAMVLFTAVVTHNINSNKEVDLACIASGGSPSSWHYCNRSGEK